MSFITRTEFKEWESNPVTRYFKKEVGQRVEDVKEELTSTDADGLKYRQGYVQALRDILEISFEEEL
jgi:hypothetical protein